MHDNQPSLFAEPSEPAREERTLKAIAEVFDLAYEYFGEPDSPADDFDEGDLPPALAKARARRLEKARELGLVAQWASYKKAKGCVTIHDPTTGEWHELPWKGAPSWAMWEVSERSSLYKFTGDASAFDLTASQIEEIWEEKHPPEEDAEEGIVEEYELPDN